MSTSGDLIAKIAVQTTVLHVDRLYDYRIPRTMADTVCVGSRVLVPFGAGNRKTEGIVLTMTDKTEFSKIKPVIALLDPAPLFDVKMLKLALWMRERCFCTFYEAAKAILPAGLWYKNTVKYGLGAQWSGKETEKAAVGDALKKSILEVLQACEKTLSEPEIAEHTGCADISKALEALVRRKIIVRSDHISRAVGDKRLKAVSLALSPEEAEIRTNTGRNRDVCKEIVRCLTGEGQITVKELCHLTGATSSMVDTLIKNGLLQSEYVQVYRRPTIKKGEKAERVVLSENQQKVFSGIADLMHGQTAKAALLFGITGSGKTLIYTELISKAIENKKSAILLVPEISLTPQMVKDFYLHFGERVAVLHSALSAGERCDEWKKIKDGDCDVVIGTRSAVFAPVKSLGIIIIDEEQEHTYKSENSPRYHARDIAKFRCVQDGALLLLGSATPSVESYYAAKDERYRLFELEERYSSAGLPDVIVADMRGAKLKGGPNSIGQVLEGEIRKNLECRQQSILFINRRGNSRMIACLQCGYIPVCDNCSTALVYHSASSRLMCHLCGASRPYSDSCPACGGTHMKYTGAGTQKIESELKLLFPEAKILRMDSDTTSAKNSHEKILKIFAAGGADILLGTQMVTKGLDFERVTLVGVIDADISLFSDDYRAAERTFSIITQVCGRSGRRGIKGRAVIQTLAPTHPVIVEASKQNYARFYEREIEIRAALDVPPFCDILAITLTGIMENEVLRAGMRLVSRINSLFSGPYKELETQVLGPSPGTVLKINRRYKYHVITRIQNNKKYRDFFAGVLREFCEDAQNRKVSVYADINPEDTF